MQGTIGSEAQELGQIVDRLVVDAAVDEELDQRRRSPGWPTPAMGCLYEYRVMRVRDPKTDIWTLHLVAVNSDTETWIVTSPVMAVSDRQMIQTTQGLWGLGTPGPGYLSAHMIGLVRAAARDGGLQKETELPIDRYAAETRGQANLTDPQSVEPRTAPSSKTTIDQLIRRNRDAAQVGQLHASELDLLVHPIAVPAEAKCDLGNWYVIYVSEGAPKETSYHIVGQRRFGSILITSPILAISPDRNIVRTQNSYYRLSVPGQGELPPGHVIAVAAVLHSWGLEVACDLATPEELRRAYGCAMLTRKSGVSDEAAS